MPTKTQELVTVTVLTPILSLINKTFVKVVNKKLPVLLAEVNTATERGIATDETARTADSIVVAAKKAIKTVKEIRLQITRPIDKKKRELMSEVENMISPLVMATASLDERVIARAAEIRRIKAEAERKYAEEQRLAEEAARKREEHNRYISLSKGGTGEVKPVEVEEVTRPISTLGTTDTARLRRIPNREKIALAVANSNGEIKIPGVRIWFIPQYKVEDTKLLPEEYTILSR